MTYKVDLPVFEGPLDLLLHLIKKDEIDIYDIPISQITKQYMDYLGVMKMLDINIAGEFLVMAATLMHIKSKMLLPEETREETEEDPRDELVKQLLEYKRFKDVASKLQTMEEHQSQFYKRSFLDDIPSEDDGFLHDVDIFDLMSAFKTIIENLPSGKEYEIFRENVSVADRIKVIFELLKDQDFINFEDIFISNITREGAVATFLAMLEMTKRGMIRVAQKGAFAHIVIERGENYQTEDNKNAGQFESIE